MGHVLVGCSLAKSSVCTERHAQQSVRCVWRVEVEASQVMGAKGGVQICREGNIWGKFNKQKVGLRNRLALGELAKSQNAYVRSGMHAERTRNHD